MKHAHFVAARDGKNPPGLEDEPPVAGKKASLVKILNDTKASQVPCSGKPVVEVTTVMTPMEAAKVLWENHILGAPVWDPNQKKYVGIFDMRDLISTVLLEQAKKDPNSPNSAWFPEGLHVSYLAARNPFVPDYHKDTSLLDLCHALSRKEAHMVPLIDPTTGRCVRILSRSYMVKFLSENVALPEISLQEAGFPYKKPVIQAPDYASAHEVFKLMDQHRLSGIAIVDSENGKLVGNTSASDIKAAVRLGQEDDDCVDMSSDILSYLAQVRQRSTFDRYPSSHVHESSTVAHAVHLLAKTGFHRVFVVDEDIRPVGVISVTDVIQYVVGHLLDQAKRQES